MIFERLTTARLTLQPVGDEAARRILAGDLTGARPAPGWPHDDTADGLRLAVEQGQPAGWLVVHDGQTVGDCGTHGPVDAEGRVEIGYGLAAPSRNQGLGTELVRAITGWLLTQPGVNAVRAHTLPDNRASRRVLERAGFSARGFDGGELLYECDRAGGP
ncbi:MAG: GNAT family N-acetyltransferase [Candidatus Dormibacteraceae bacterium]